MNLTLSVTQDIRQDLQDCRASTLAIFSQLNSDNFSQQVHTDFSPVGWHLGHIAFTEAYWILEQLAGLPPIFPEYRQLFAADGLPKSQRQNLPSIKFIRDYLDIVRDKVLAYLERENISTQERLWRWLIQHESQHAETIAILLHLQGNLPSHEFLTDDSPQPRAEMVKIPAGEFILGNEQVFAQDNERPVWPLNLASYWLDKYPVTWGEYQEFLAAGGYRQEKYWSEAGWQWLQTYQITQPLYSYRDAHKNHYPVYGVSWYEADAYARFRGKRLPTEAEWEKAASWNIETQSKSDYPWGNSSPNTLNCNYHNHLRQTTPVNAYPAGKSVFGCYDLLGNVWEWTASVFAGYPGMKSYPYPGYSQVYFDGQHYVLKGGSWATRSWGLRNSFRNWYPPQVRQIFAGFRCASDG